MFKLVTNFHPELSFLWFSGWSDCSGTFESCGEETDQTQGFSGTNTKAMTQMCRCAVRHLNFCMRDIFFFFVVAETWNRMSLGACVCCHVFLWKLVKVANLSVTYSSCRFDYAAYFRGYDAWLANHWGREGRRMDRKCIQRSWLSYSFPTINGCKVQKIANLMVWGRVLKLILYLEDVCVIQGKDRIVLDKVSQTS